MMETETMHFDDSTFAGRLRHVRGSCGLTQSEVAEAMGQASAAAVSHWETGRREPSAGNLRELLVPFPNLSLHWLLTGLDGWTVSCELT